MLTFPKNELARLLIRYFEVFEIDRVVISPGSRNAPLSIGFFNHPKIKVYSVVDERSAGFFALGLAQQSQKPVAVVSTSGSAVLNYYPAVAEAYYSNLPLIVVSADRPAHLIDIRDGQTIRQEHVFRNHIHFSANLKENAGIPANGDKINEALQTVFKRKGPVHINIPFDEPLYDVVNDLGFENIKRIDEKRDSLLDETPLDVDALQQYADIWNAASKKMVLLGTCNPDPMVQTQLAHLAKDPSVLILTETTSNVYHDKFVNGIDKLIMPLSDAEQADLQPDILLTFGGMVVSKKIKQFLRRFKPKRHWHVDRFEAPDTYHALTHHFKVSAQLFFSQFFFLTTVKNSEYQPYWLSVFRKRAQKHSEFLQKTPFSDLKVFETLFAAVPDQVLLQLSNSSVIRYSQLFDLSPGLRVFCNRGTSGIDGCTSTAVGAAHVFPGQTLLVSGDISFFYDSNALWNNYLNKQFRIIVINNSGGGIFRFIPGPKENNALELFETPHKLTAKPLCDLYGLEYRKATNEDELHAALNGFFDPGPQPKLLEVFTPAEENDLVLKAYFKNLTSTEDPTD